MHDAGRCAVTVAALALLGAPLLRAQQPSTISLPAPRHDGAVTLDSAMWARRSVRALARDQLTLEQVAQLLWAAHGVNRPDGRQTVPSAGGTNALEVRLIAARVRGLAPGVYRYAPAGHTLERLAEGDRVGEVVAASRQAWIADAPAIVVLSAAYDRTARRYGERAQRYVPIEAGAAAQNLYLACAGLGLATTYVGAFSDSAAARIAVLGAGETPLGMLPVGRPR